MKETTFVAKAQRSFEQTARDWKLGFEKDQDGGYVYGLTQQAFAVFMAGYRAGAVDERMGNPFH